MRALTARQATACELSRSPKYRCRCRCGGLCHGRGQLYAQTLDLPDGDPHHITPPKAVPSRIRS